MNALLEIMLSNVLMAGVLAVPATLAGLWGRRPAFTHGLWLLVLLKLVTPPLFQMAVTWPTPPAPLADVQPALTALAEALPDAPTRAAIENPPTGQVAIPEPPSTELAASAPRPVPEGPAFSEPQAVVPPPVAVAPVSAEAVDFAWTTWIAGLGLAGSAAWLVLAARRLRRFQRLLRFACPASGAVQQEARTLAEAMGVRCPQVLLMPAAISPMLWVGRSPRLLLPDALVERLRPQQLATVMAHELAHWRRGDHRVRWLEMLVLSLYWWCPLAWWARRQLQQAEEECCDAWVVALLPDAARDYALALVDTIDFLSGASAPLPPVASGAGHVRLLKRRLTMILRGTTPQSLTRVGLLAVTGLGLFLLPFVPGRAQQPGEKPVADKATADFVNEINQQLLAHPETPIQVDPNKLNKIQQDLHRRHEELAEQRRQIERQINDLAAALQRLKTQGKVTAKPSSSQAPQAPTPAPAPYPPMGGSAPAGWQPTSGVEQRLEQVERKLDVLLWEIANMRRDMTKGRSPMGPPGGMMPPGMGRPGGGGAPGKAFPAGGAPGLPGKPGSSGTSAAPSGGATPPNPNNLTEPPGAETLANPAINPPPLAGPPALVQPPNGLLVAPPRKK
jgi:beta-lactamase regulating signal transducer with metallopeptidase domain